LQQITFPDQACPPAAPGPTRLSRSRRPLGRTEHASSIGNFGSSSPWRSPKPVSPGTNPTAGHQWYGDGHRKRRSSSDNQIRGHVFQQGTQSPPTQKQSLAKGPSGWTAEGMDSCPATLAGVQALHPSIRYAGPVGAGPTRPTKIHCPHRNASLGKGQRIIPRARGEGHCNSRSRIHASSPSTRRRLHLLDDETNVFPIRERSKDKLGHHAARGCIHGSQIAYLPPPCTESPGFPRGRLAGLLSRKTPFVPRPAATPSSYTRPTIFYQGYRRHLLRRSLRTACGSRHTALPSRPGTSQSPAQRVRSGNAVLQSGRKRFCGTDFVRWGQTKRQEAVYVNELLDETGGPWTTPLCEFPRPANFATQGGKSSRR